MILLLFGLFVVLRHNTGPKRDNQKFGSVKNKKWKIRSKGPKFSHPRNLGIGEHSLL